MAKHLVLLESGLLPGQLDRLGRSIVLDNDTLVFLQERKDERHLSNIRASIISVDDIIPLNSEHDQVLYDIASNLIKHRKLANNATGQADPTQYHSQSLWEQSYYRMTSFSWQSLKRIEALKKLVSSWEIKRFYSFEIDGVLWDEFCIATGLDDGTSGINRVKVKPLVSHGRSFYFDKMPIWMSLPISDLYIGVQSYPRPSLKRHQAQKQQHPILFLVNPYGTYLNTALPIIDQIANSEGAIVFSTGGVLRQPGLARSGVEVTYGSKYISLPAWSSIRRRAHALQEAWKSLEIDEGFQEQFILNGNNMWPIFRKKLKYDFKVVYPRLMAWTEGIERLLRVRQPTAVVAVPDRHPRARIALSLARAHGIPSLTIQGALLADNPRYGPMYADRVAVIDGFSGDVIRERGSVPAERINITGTPRWDKVAAQLASAGDNAKQNKGRKSLGIDLNQRIVVFATQALPYKQTARMIRPLLQALSTFSETIRLVIKLHPMEASGADEELLKELDCVAEVPIIVKQIDLYGLLAASELLVTGFSNVALEAALLDRAVMIINLTGEPDPLPFVEQGIAVGAYSENEVENLCRALLEDTETRSNLRESRRRYLKQNPQMLDGKATERVVNLLEEMIRESSPEWDQSSVKV